MSDLRLHTVLEPIGPAGAIVLTDEQVATLGSAKTLPVTVRVGDRVGRLRLARMGGQNLIGFSKAARAELGVELGQEIDVVIAPGTAERTVEVPPALGAALAKDPAAQAAFDGLSYSRRKEMARQVADAKQDATRERRLAKVLAELRG